MNAKKLLSVFGLLVTLLGQHAQAYYNATTGRWLNRDPMDECGGVAGYIFAINSTVNRYDVAGLKDYSHKMDIHEAPWDDTSWVPLTGDLGLSVDSFPVNQIRISFKLDRPATAANMARWASPEYSGRGRTEYWSEPPHGGWRWPNLAALFRTKRPRYGGVDPGNNRDNDFGAVAVKRESTYGPLLVSGDWVNENGAIVLPQLSHAARIRNKFTIGLRSASNGCPPEPIMVWFVYCDLGGFDPLSDWPLEFDGTAFAFVKINWRTTGDGGIEPEFSSPVPPPPTRFNWQGWHLAGAPEWYWDLGD